ncbi:MAG TPA: metallophosphoesterase [Nitrososphaeraceae archaeon]|nr:metallophosphoesterase [Nitrososphaeraceae archaeon]
MPKIQYILYPSLILILLTFFISIALSQVVTNNSNVNSSITQPGRINESTSVSVIDMVGDIECSDDLHDQVKMDNPSLFVALGDLCYESDLDDFIDTYSDLKNADKLACLIGNHESEEDGNLEILNQTLEYCGDHWYRKIANGTTLLIGLNTNGDTKLQTKWGQSLVTNSTLMKGIKNVMLLTHKPAHTPPESYHPAENSTIRMISGIESNISKSIQVYEIAAHNHFMAASSNGRWFISGGGEGGESHHEASTNSTWPFLNNEDYGYLQIRINNTDGKVLSTQFYGLDED